MTSDLGGLVLVVSVSGSIWAGASFGAALDPSRTGVLARLVEGATGGGSGAVD